MILRFNFPLQPPYVTIVCPPGAVLAKIEYLAGYEIRIPYLTSWNPYNKPIPTLVFNSKYIFQKDLVAELIKIFTYYSPFVSHPGYQHINIYILASHLILQSMLQILFLLLVRLQFQFQFVLLVLLLLVLLLLFTKIHILVMKKIRSIQKLNLQKRKN